MADTTTTDAGAPAEPEKGWRDRVELAAAILLGLAAVLTAFAAYRASLTDDEVLKGYSEANEAMQEGYDQLSAGDQASNFEQNVFLQYAVEISAGNQEGADYLRATMSPELDAVVTVWEETDDDVATPFDGDYAELDDLESSLFYAEGDALLDQADDLRASAEDADEKSDIYELASVLLAVTLFLAGVAALITSKPISAGLLVLGSVMLIGGFVVLVQAEMA
jgi:hypothetical protein